MIDWKVGDRVTLVQGDMGIEGYYSNYAGRPAYFFLPSMPGIVGAIHVPKVSRKKGTSDEFMCIDYLDRNGLQRCSISYDEIEKRIIPYSVWVASEDGYLDHGMNLSRIRAWAKIAHERNNLSVLKFVETYFRDWLDMEATPRLDDWELLERLAIFHWEKMQEKNYRRYLREHQG